MKAFAQWERGYVDGMPALFALAGRRNVMIGWACSMTGESGPMPFLKLDEPPKPEEDFRVSSADPRGGLIFTGYGFNGGTVLVADREDWRRLLAVAVDGEFATVERCPAMGGGSCETYAHIPLVSGRRMVAYPCGEGM